MEASKGHETVEPKPDPVREKVDEWLSGIQATREGSANVFFIRGSDNRSEMVTAENADEVETRIRGGFSELYPDLIVIEGEAVEIAGELNAGPSPESPQL